jgi:dephospho-CoA kinase
MKVIGLTGNIGCGKSTVAGMLRRLGAAVIDADRVARELRQSDGETRAAIEQRFGTIDAKRLADRVFGDPVALGELEAILHPRVRDVVRTRLAELEGLGAPAVVVEAIKLLESPLHDRCDETWVVRCDEPDAIRRLASARQMSEAEARARLAHQSPQDEKLAVADVVIDGSAPMEEMRRQVEEAYRRLVT